MGVYDLYYLDQDWGLLTQLDRSCLVRELLSVSLKLKSEPCKIVKNIVKYRVLGSGGSKVEPKRAPKVVFFYSQHLATTL